MSHFPVTTGKRLVKLLCANFGFTEVRQSGSHVVLKNFERNISVTVPVHGKRDLPIGTLRSILRDAKVDEDEFRQYV
jgi:predicted RNA binding protein YcfA (HicA-like mRNA interferase family)